MGLGVKLRMLLKKAYWSTPTSESLRMSAAVEAARSGHCPVDVSCGRAAVAEEGSQRAPLAAPGEALEVARAWSQHEQQLACVVGSAARQPPRSPLPQPGGAPRPG
jgi:hypothetical protein